MNKIIFILVILADAFLLSACQTATPSPAEREAEEYAVYHAILNRGCIKSHTLVGDAIISADYPELDSKLIEDYNSHQESVPYKPELDRRPGLITLISDAEMDEIFATSDLYEGWRRFHERCSGIEGVSRVGFSAKMNKALVYYGYQAGPIEGVGELIVLVKGDDGKWEIEKKYTLWES